MDKKTKKKPIGYTKEQTSSMKKLFERVDPKAGDYVGGGTVTEVKNKKKMKRMQMGGMAMMDRSSRFGRGPMGRMERPAKPGMGGDKMIQGSRGVSNSPGRISPYYAKIRAKASPITQAKTSPITQAKASPITQIESKTLTGMRPDPVTGMMPTPVPRVGETVPRRTLKGGGLARKGVGMALAKGGIVKAPARSYKDMKAGAGSGVGRIQKTKIQRGR